MGPLMNKRHRKRDRSETEANAPPKVLRTNHAFVRPGSHTRGGKSLAVMGLGAGSIVSTPIPQETPANVIGPDLLSYARPQSSKGTAAAEDPKFEKSTSFTSLAGSPGGIYQPGWGVTNDCRLDTPEACQDMVAMGSQLRLRFEQEVRLRREATAKIARRDQRIQAREEEIKKLDEEVKSLRVVETEVHSLRNRTQNLETLLEAEVGMKKAAEAKNAELVKELEILLIQFSDLQVNNDQLSQHVYTLQSQITREEKIKAAFEEFKRYKDDRCEESMELRQAFANVVSAGITKGFFDGLKYGVELGEVKLDLANIEAYDPKAEGKFTATMQALKDLKYPLIDELEKLKDAPMDIIMASLYLESDTGEDAPQWIRDLRPSSAQLKISVYPEVRDPKDPWAFKEELLLKDVIAANVSRAEKKRKCQIVCRTYGVGSAHHARSNGIPVSVPTAPQGLQILLKDAASQTELSEDGASPRLVISKSLPAMYNLDWP
ncbi:hypothetical protein Tco_0955260 [Tanacetum coccineum]|uniref:Transposase (Putative), gypsy type n=1 Tax=Tanacetum coccineum TaxID=301880 RepID=A0ABQ5E6P6_9ASTR